MNPSWLACGLLLLALPAAGAEDSTRDCHIGIYRLSDKSTVDIAPSDEGRLRWRRLDGTSGALTRNDDGTWRGTYGWTDRPDGKRVSFSSCDKGDIRFGGLDGKRIPLSVTETQFASGDTPLAGRLLMPRGWKPVPIVVLVHGSEDMSARDFYALQRLFPAAGIGAFVYDKRGTGGSGGQYTQNYDVLANDAVAAVREAQRLAGPRAGRIGFQGSSQGGWVAPLAATRTSVDFVIVAYGLAVSPVEEDREAMALDMTRHGFGADVVKQALEIADATEAILVSNFTSGFDRLATVRAKYEHEPWFKYVHGNYSFLMLQLSEAQVREQGPKLARGIIAHYDPMPVLRDLDTPQLWILGADDIDAPSAETLRRLRDLAASGKPIDVAVFPHAEHGLLEYEVAADGTRLSTRNPQGYFAMMRDFALKGRLTGAYGRSWLYLTAR